MPIARAVAQASILVPTLRNGDIVFMNEIAQSGGLQEACSERIAHMS